jgi:hypothetical protein
MKYAKTVAEWLMGFTCWAFHLIGHGCRTCPCGGRASRRYLWVVKKFI